MLLPSLFGAKGPLSSAAAPAGGWFTAYPLARVTHQRITDAKSASGPAVYLRLYSGEQFVAYPRKENQNNFFIITTISEYVRKRVTLIVVAEPLDSIYGQYDQAVVPPQA